MIKVTNHPTDANQNNNEVPSHTCQNSYHQQMTSTGEDVQKTEPSYIAGGNADLCSLCRKQYGVSSKKLKMKLPFDPVIPLLGIYSMKSETPIRKNICTHMFIATQFTIAKIWKQPKCPSDEWIKKMVVHLHNEILCFYKKRKNSCHLQ
uniref:Uncharacterized protein n=1 Tax=Myotis myotis TaxID=51298 RepID=A0A7J7YDP6_MYOMY|nr:hypothetical protein mMyoMyo1_011040 [Myotis myotis]